MRHWYNELGMNWAVVQFLALTYCIILSRGKVFVRCYKIRNANYGQSGAELVTEDESILLLTLLSHCGFCFWGAGRRDSRYTTIVIFTWSHLKSISHQIAASLSKKYAETVEVYVLCHSEISLIFVFYSQVFRLYKARTIHNILSTPWKNYLFHCKIVVKRCRKLSEFNVKSSESLSKVENKHKKHEVQR